MGAARIPTLLGALILLLPGCSCDWGASAWDEHPCAPLEAGVDPAVADGFRGAGEFCNGRDDDCDALVDEEDPDLVGARFYADRDGDGFGDPDSPVIACERPDGVVEDATDCDDTDPDAHPGGTELWDDGKDSDCDGALDPDPCLAPPPPPDLAADPACTLPFTPGPFQTQLEWQTTWTFGVECPGCDESFGTPVVGRLLDENGDGRVDEEDAATVAVVQFGGSEAVVRLISGRDGSILDTLGPAAHGGATWAPHPMSEVSLGDVDADGEPELVTFVRHDPAASVCRVAAFSTDGAIEWIDGGLELPCVHHAAALVDLDGDGAVEVLVGGAVLRGADGSLRGKGEGGQGFDPSYENAGYHSFGIDLDGLGALEVVAGSSVYDADGVERCSTGDPDGYPAAADLDGDPQGEMVVVGGGSVRLYEHDCTPIRSWSHPGGGGGGPPTIADFDGDGEPEIGVADAEFYSVWEVNGDLLWSKPVYDGSGGTGSAVFDFEGDGTAEVVYGDENTLWIFAGGDGAVLLADESHTAGTRNEYPVVADLDADGRAEIVVTNSSNFFGGSGSVHALGAADDRWVSARPTWNQHAFRGLDAGDDLSLPAAPPVGWPAFNSFRQGRPGAVVPDAAPNLGLQVWGPCPGEGSEVVLGVRVLNDGQLPVAPGVEVVLTGEPDAGGSVALGTRSSTERVPAGGASEVLEFGVNGLLLSGYARLVLAVDPSLSVRECREDDNERLIPGPFE